MSKRYTGNNKKRKHFFNAETHRNVIYAYFITLFARFKSTTCSQYLEPFRESFEITLVSKKPVKHVHRGPLVF